MHVLLVQALKIQLLSKAVPFSSSVIMVVIITRLSSFLIFGARSVAPCALDDFVLKEIEKCPRSEDHSYPKGTIGYPIVDVSSSTVPEPSLSFLFPNSFELFSCCDMRHEIGVCGTYRSHMMPYGGSLNMFVKPVLLHFIETHT